MPGMMTSTVAAATIPTTTASSSSVNARPLCVLFNIWVTSFNQVVEIVFALVVDRPRAAEARRSRGRRRRDHLAEPRGEQVEVAQVHHAVVGEVALREVA